MSSALHGAGAQNGALASGRKPWAAYGINVSRNGTMKPVLKLAKSSLAFGVCLLVVAIIVVALFATGPKQLAASAVTIVATKTMTNHAVVSVTISNTLDISTIFDTINRSPSLKIFVSDGERWTNVHVPSVGSGSYVLPPHGTVATQVEIPAGVIKAKFGLEVTPFSRSSQIIYTWLIHHDLDFLSGVTKWLFATDLKKSVEVWSDVIPVGSGVRGGNNEPQNETKSTRQP